MKYYESLIIEFEVNKIINILVIMNVSDIPIPELYREINHITDHGIPGYYVNKKYEDPVQMMKSR